MIPIDYDWLDNSPDIRTFVTHTHRQIKWPGLGQNDRRLAGKTWGRLSLMADIKMDKKMERNKRIGENKFQTKFNWKFSGCNLFVCDSRATTTDDSQQRMMTLAGRRPHLRSHQVNQRCWMSTQEVILRDWLASVAFSFKRLISFVHTGELSVFELTFDKFAIRSNERSNCFDQCSLRSDVW